MKPVKQVIVIRRDLKMRRGKEIAQGSHASIAFLTRKLQKSKELKLSDLNEAQTQWIEDSFTKVTLQVDTAVELIKLHNKALDLGLESHLIIDNGTTEFGGRDTYTALAIGPDYSDKIDNVTGDLKLY